MRLKIKSPQIVVDRIVLLEYVIEQYYRKGIEIKIFEFN